MTDDGGARSDLWSTEALERYRARARALGEVLVEHAELVAQLAEPHQQHEAVAASAG